MELLIFLAGPAILGTGLYTKDWFVIWFGVAYIGLFAVAYVTRRYNARRIARERAVLIERFYDETVANQTDDISR